MKKQVTGGRSEWGSRRRDGNREIPPSTDGYRIRSGSTILGELEVSSGALLAFHWYQTQSSWPTDFDLISSTVSGTITQSDKFEHSVFNSASVSFDKGDCQWRIEQGGVTIGYLYKTTDKLVWYATNLAPTALYFDAGEVNFKTNTDTGTGSARDATDLIL